MKRIALTDGSGKWFDEEKAEKFEEKIEGNGNNSSSKATGSQWNHEKLFRTASGKWILNQGSQMQDSLKIYIEMYKEISDDEAAKWLVINGHDSDIVYGLFVDLEL